jgi:hypothetical protein
MGRSPKAKPVELSDKPIGGALTVGFVRGIGRNAGHSQKNEQTLEASLKPSVDLSQNSVQFIAHGIYP